MGTIIILTVYSYCEIKIILEQCLSRGKWILLIVRYSMIREYANRFIDNITRKI